MDDRNDIQELFTDDEEEYEDEDIQKDVFDEIFWRNGR